MSHNTASVNSKTPDITGEISCDLGDLADVTLTSVGPSQVLQYNSTSSDWENATLSGGAAQYIWIGGDYSVDYDLSPHGTGAFSNGDTLYIYNNNATVNSISGSSVTSTSNWTESITLPAGDYFIQGQTMFVFSSSGYAAYRWETSAAARVTQYGVVGEARGTSYGPSNSNAAGYISFTSSTTIKLVLKASSGLGAGSAQTTTPSQYGFIYIEKLS
jgi:hypothetical protein